jgi:hypothetical protein
MSYQLLNEFTGSTIFPSRRWLDREDFYSLTEKAYLLILALRVLIGCPNSQEWATGHLKQTLQGTNFHSWRSTGTDLYVVLWALTQGEYERSADAPESVMEAPFLRWLRALRNDPNDTTETRRLFLKLDSLLHNSDSSLKALRRLIQDWPQLSRDEQQVTMTRLLQIMRARVYRAECLPHLNRAARAHKLELSDVCDLETGDGCNMDHHDAPKKITLKQKEKTPGTALGFLAGLAGLATGYAASKGLRKLGETATAGATAASSVAAVSTNLGGEHPGFDSNGHQGVYQKTGKPKKTSIIRRPPIA